MSTSDLAPRVSSPPLRPRAAAPAPAADVGAPAATTQVALEVAGGALLVTTIVALASPDDLWLLDIGFHPGWAIVLIFAARYATRGLLLGLGLMVAMLSAASLALGGDLAGLSVRAHALSDMLVLATGTLVAWIAMLHEGRIARATQRLGDATARRRLADETIEAMKDVIAVLRARHDRIDMSLSMWRDVAARLEGEDPADAAGAALELGAIRSGAAAGVVLAWDGARLENVAWRGQWSPADPRPQEGGDRTSAAALGERRPITAAEVAGAGEGDSDVAVPIVDDDGETLRGVIAFRGVAPGRLRAADLRDLAVIARWLAPSLARRAVEAEAVAQEVAQVIETARTTGVIRPVGREGGGGARA